MMKMMKSAQRVADGADSSQKTLRQCRKNNSLSEQALFASVSAAIGDNEAKLFIHESNQSNQHNKSVPEYFTMPQFDSTRGVVQIVTKWTQDPQECLEDLSTLVKLKQKYLYELVPWILEQMQGKNGFQETKQYIDSIYRPLTPPLSIGSFVEIIDLDGSNQYSIGVVLDHVEMKQDKDFEWRQSEHKNNIVQILDTSLTRMEQPVSPPDTDNRQLNTVELDEIDIFRYLDPNTDMSGWDFEKKYYVLQLHLEKVKNEWLQVQLQESDEYVDETCQQQMDILVRLAQAKLRPDYHGEPKSVSVGWNANFWFHGLKEKLESNNIEIKKRGYVSRANISDDDVQVIFGNNADLTVVTVRASYYSSLCVPLLHF